MPKNRSLEVVELKTVDFSGDVLELESGQELKSITIAYETYGRLNADRSNAVLIEHGFSGDSHAAGSYKDDDSPGWWDGMIGPGKAFDTDKYFVICSNVIGGCKGSTGPSSVNPSTGKPYGIDFPFVTIADMVKAQKLLVESLGIEKLLCVSGGSMGGMQSLQWAASYPEKVKCIIPIATTLKHSPQQIAFNEVGRQAVMTDANWNEGHYYGGEKPERGLAVARMIGHITYMSERSMEKKFSRKLKTNNYTFSFKADFEVEGYLRYRGDNFVKRFDANSYLYITKAMDYFDLSEGKLFENWKKEHPSFLVMSFRSDWLYPPAQSQEIVRQLKSRAVDISYLEINSSYGHDSFLLEFEEQTHMIKHFLGNRQ